MGQRKETCKCSVNNAWRNLLPDEKSGVKFYKTTKSGVDILDKIVHGFSLKQKYRMWSMHVFFALLDGRIYASHKMMEAVVTRSNKDFHYKFKKPGL